MYMAISKAAGLHELSSFLKVELQKSLKWSYIYLCLASHHYILYAEFTDARYG